MGISNYSTTPGSNTSAPPNGAPIGTTKASQVDDIIRQIMADVRSWYETPHWRNLGHVPTYASSSSFTIPDDVTASYVVGQRLMITDSVTLYGTVSGSSYSAPNTTISVALDSGAVSASITAVSAGVSPSNDSIPAEAISGLAAEIAEEVPQVFANGELAQSGDLKATARSSAPTGWLLCYGQAVSRGTYSALFTAIGTTYGNGDGSTTFNLPDLRGRAVFGVDNMGGSAAGRVTSGVSGITGTTLGASGGSEAMHQHTHPVTDPGHVHAINSFTAVGNTGGGGAGLSFSTTGGIDTRSSSTGITIANAGTGSSQNMPPAIMFNWVIKT